jgi:ketosteroid isomerase-like protein
VHVLHRGRRGGAQLLAQQPAQALVDPQSLGDVALSLERLHQQCVAALPVGGEIDQAPCCGLRDGDLGSTDAEAPPRGAFQSPDPDVLQLSWDSETLVAAVLTRDSWAMASANLDLVRSIFAGWERGDFSSVEWADPEIEYVHVDGPAPGDWKGPGEMTEGFRDVLSALEGFRVEADEYRELDSERVLVLIHYLGRGKTSELDIGQMQSEAASLFHVRTGTVSRLVFYFNRERALIDLGLNQ